MAVDPNSNPDAVGDPTKIVVDPDKTPVASSTDTDDDKINKLVSERIEEALKPIKENLNAAYAARDEALKKIAEREQKEKEEEIKRLTEEGKHKEAFDKQLAVERAEKEALSKRNIELTRDVELRGALNAVDFRNKNATEMAFKEISAELVRNENGAWVHKSGVPIHEYVTTFVANEDNAFLLKLKANTGTGSTATTTSPANSGDKKSLFSMTQAEVLKLAAEGKLPGR